MTYRIDENLRVRSAFVRYHLWMQFHTMLPRAFNFDTLLSPKSKLSDTSNRLLIYAIPVDKITDEDVLAMKLRFSKEDFSINDVECDKFYDHFISPS